MLRFSKYEGEWVVRGTAEEIRAGHYVNVRKANGQVASVLVVATGRAIPGQDPPHIVYGALKGSKLFSPKTRWERLREESNDDIILETQDEVLL